MYVYVCKHIFVWRDLHFFHWQKGKVTCKELQSNLFLNFYINQLKYILLKKDILAYEFKRKIYHLLIYT